MAHGLSDNAVQAGPPPQAQDDIESGDSTTAPLRRWPSHLAWLPIPILLVAIIAARAAGLRGTFESPALTLTLSFVFYTLVSLGTIFLIGRSFLASGLPGLLLLECGVVLWSLAGTVGDAVSQGDANINVTIFNTGILLAGVCHLSGSILALWPQRALQAKRLWLGTGCALAVGALALVVEAATTHWLPVFFVPGQGGTMVRYVVLISAITLFTLSAALLYPGSRPARAARAVRPAFASWYALALLLLAVGLFGIMIQLSLGSVVNWLGRTGQWLGGLYLLLAALAAMRESKARLLPSADQAQPTHYRYAIAVVVVLVAAVVRLLFLPALGTQSPFVTFYAAVILAALYGGWRGGLAATFLAVVTGDYFWIAPVGRFTMGAPADWLTVMIFLTSGALVSYIVEVMQRAQKRTAAAEAEARIAAERARVAEALRESEEHFRLGAAASHAMVYDLDVRTLRVNAMHGLHALLGYESAEAELTLDWWDQRIVPEDLESCHAAFQRMRADGQGHMIQYRLRHKDGHTLWVEDRATGMRDESGELVRVVGTVVDITEHKQAEEALRESEQRYRSLFDNMLDGYAYCRMVHDNGEPSDFVYLGVNHAFERFTGLKDVVGKRVSEVIPGIQASGRELIRTYGRVASTGQPERFETYVEAMGIWFLVSVYSPAKDHFVAVFDNITERKQAEEELKVAKVAAEQAQAAAEHASKAKDHFLAVLSHELRNPLNPVLATATMLRDDPRFDADTREQLDVICRNAEMEARLIDDLLDVTRIERGKVELDRRPIDLGTILRRAIEVCMPDVEARELHFGVDAPDGPYWLDADAGRLQQVFWNLIKNAVKFTPKGGCVGIRCRRDGEGFVVAEVNDSGVGIDPDVLPRLFNAFEQAERSITRQFGGLGLGLTISKAIAEMHGGTLTARSEGKEKGATFALRLPMLPAGTVVATAESNTGTTPAAAATRPLRILLVEDHGDTARIMRRFLMIDGHEVQMAADVATALKLAAEESFDLMLSDLGLPDGSGMDLMRAIRAKGLELPGIALSGYGQEKDLQQSGEAGFAAHLVKPVSPPRLREAIARLCLKRQ